MHLIIRPTCHVVQLVYVINFVYVHIHYDDSIIFLFIQVLFKKERNMHLMK